MPTRYQLHSPRQDFWHFVISHIAGVSPSSLHDVSFAVIEPYEWIGTSPHFCGLVSVCDNMAFHGDFTPVLAKHTKRFSLVDALAVGVDRMQRNFEPMRRQVEAWKGSLLPDDAARVIIYRAFVQGELEVPKHLARRVHELYFSPAYPEFAARTLWSLSNAFTSAFREMDPIPQFRAAAKLAPFLESVQ